MENLIVFKLSGLDCGHCASTIETKVLELSSVSSANLNFVTKELKIYLKDDTIKNDEIKKIISLINSIEPSIKVLQGNNYDYNQEKTFNTFKLVRIILGSIIFLLSYKFPYLSIFLLAYIILGYDILFKAFKNIFKGKIFDENFLMSIATIGAFFIKEFPEAVAVMLFYQIGAFFQELAVGKSRIAIQSLLNIKAEFATKENGQKLSPEQINVDEIIIVKPGEKIPLDGIVVEGNSFLDMSALIGETVPRKASVGDEVFSGTINKNSLLKIKVTKKYSDSTVAKILDLVENSSAKKSKAENFIRKFAKIYTPIVVYIALFLAIVPPFFYNFDFVTWIERSLVFLVSSCPCALVVSIPLSFFSGIGTASKNGILIKGSMYMQNLSEVDAIVFDKTGTLTKGVFNINKLNPVNCTEDELLKLAYILECSSIHPIAKAISSYYENKFSVDKFDVKQFEEISGYGLIGVYNNEQLLVGNYKLLEKYKINFEKINDIGSIVYVAKNGQYMGSIVVSDIVKDEAKNTISNLKKLGIKSTFMLSGDKYETAKFVSNEVGIDNFFAELLPQDKVYQFEQILNSNKYNKVAFVGDGINDAPVLAISDVGFAMGGVGSDAAIQSADAIIMNDNLEKICQSILISKNTIKIVKTNVKLSLFIKFIVLFLAIFGFVSIWLAVFADVGVSVIAILNSMRKKI